MALNSADHIRIFVVHLTPLHLSTPAALFGSGKLTGTGTSLEVYKKQIIQAQRVVNHLSRVLIELITGDFLNQPLQYHESDIAIEHTASNGTNKRLLKQQFS